MISELASADAIVWLSIAVKALAYTSTLIALGSPLVLLALSSLDENGQSFTRRMAMFSSLAALLFSSLRIPLQASILMGGGWSGAWDPMVLSIVAESPLGTAVAVRAVGLLLILALALRHPAALPLALAGSLLVALSFALRGHSLEEPSLVLAALITVHVLCLGFWVGALLPLLRASRAHDPHKLGALAHQFGTIAIGSVAVLTLAGIAMLALFGVLGTHILGTSYGQGFLAKLALLVVVLAFAAWNKLVLTPNLQSGCSTSVATLRRSIISEAGVMTLIVVTTATVTTISSPD